jgi:hypothetical protein
VNDDLGSLMASWALFQQNPHMVKEMDVPSQCRQERFRRLALLASFRQCGVLLRFVGKLKSWPLVDRAFGSR